MKNPPAAVIALCLLSAVSARAFDSAAYFNRSVYNPPEFHMTCSPWAGIEWDYDYGFAKNNRPSALYGFEFAWMKFPAAGGFGWFPKLRLMAGRELRSDYRSYRYEGVRDLSVIWIPPVTASKKAPRFLREGFFLPLPAAELTLNLDKTYRTGIRGVPAIRPSVGLGGGAQTIHWDSSRFNSAANTDIRSVSKYGFYYAIAAAGADLVVVPELLVFRIDCRFAFGGVQPVDGGDNGAGYRGFHTSLNLSLAMNYYLF